MLAARRIYERLTREVAVDLVLMAALCVEYALAPAQREQIRGILAAAAANLVALIKLPTPPLIEPYGLAGWNWRHRDFWAPPRERPAAWLSDVAGPAPLRNATLRVAGGRAYLLAGGHFAAPTRVLPPTAFTLPLDARPRSLAALGDVPDSVVQRVARVDLEPFGYAPVSATQLAFAPSQKRIETLAVKYGVGAEDLRVFDGPRGETLVLHVDYDASRRRVRHYLSVVEDDELANTVVLEPPETVAQPCEKNWCAFVHGSDVYFSHALEPHAVLRLGDGGACELAHVSGARTPRALRGSSNFLRSTAGYLGLAHERRGSRYRHRWVRLDGEPPFAVLAVSPPFLFFPGGDGAEFATTIQAAPGKKRPALLVSVGVRDSHTRFLRCAAAAVCAAVGAECREFAWLDKRPP